MYMPTLKINLRKLEENARTEKAGDATNLLI